MKPVACCLDPVDSAGSSTACARFKPASAAYLARCYSRSSSYFDFQSSSKWAIAAEDLKSSSFPQTTAPLAIATLCF